MRLQLALNVRDLDEAVTFYSRLFGVQPHKRRPGYANFAIETPPLKLVLFENPHAIERLNHLGIEVLQAEQLEAAERRLAAAGLVGEIRRGEACCFATQDKTWVTEPEGLRWEWYRVTDDEPSAAEEGPDEECCATDRGAPACGVTTGDADACG